MFFSIHVVLRSVAEIERLGAVMWLLTRSNQGLINAFEHWSWELRLVQGVSLKILSSEAKGNNKKRHEIFFPQNRSQCVLFFFFALYRSALDPRMNSNKFETGTLKNVTGSCIKPTKFSKNIAFTPKRIEFLNLPSRTDLTSS